jgi:hypothetical protein
MSYSFVDSFRAGPESILVLLKSCLQTCMTYASAECTVNKTPDDGQRNCSKHLAFHSQNKFEKLVHLVGFIIKKFITMHGHMNVKLLQHVSASLYCHRRVTV